MALYKILRYRNMSEVWRKLLFRPKPMCFVLLVFKCSIHWFLSKVHLRSQSGRFPSWTDGKRRKTFNLSQIQSADVLSTALLLLTSLFLRAFPCTYFRIVLYLKIPGQMFSDVAQIQLNKIMFSQFTALQKAHVSNAVLPPKLIGISYSPNICFHLWASVRI